MLLVILPLFVVRDFWQSQDGNSCVKISTPGSVWPVSDLERSHGSDSNFLNPRRSELAGETGGNNLHTTFFEPLLASSSTIEQPNTAGGVSLSLSSKTIQSLIQTGFFQTRHGFFSKSHLGQFFKSDHARRAAISDGSGQAISRPSHFRRGPCNIPSDFISARSLSLSTLDGGAFSHGSGEAISTLSHFRKGLKR